MRRGIMGILLGSAAAPIIDWSGVYSGGAIGGAWGRERLDRDVTTFDEPTLRSNLLGTNSLGFGTSRASVDPVQGRLSVLFPIQ